MQFKKAQRAQLHKTWNPKSWFYQHSSLPIRDIIAKAYGITLCKAAERQKCQEDVSLALSIFARKLGCDKAHVTHALLTGDIQALIRATVKFKGQSMDDRLQTAYAFRTGFDSHAFVAAWEHSFRDINVGIALVEA